VCVSSHPAFFCSFLYRAVFYWSGLSPSLLASGKRTEAEAAAKAKGSGERPTGQASGRQPGYAREKTVVTYKVIQATAGKCEANKLDSAGSMESASRRPAHGPVSRARSAPLLSQARGIPDQGVMVKSTASTGEQAASNGRQLSYSEVDEGYAGVAAGRPVEE
jgi:hypothetical protein